MDEAGITIIGAGIIGLAIAAELSTQYTDIFVIEKNDSYGQETSSRNSEVIHAGLYYPEDSLKFRLCIEGSHYLYEACQKFSIPHKQIGKLIIATEASEVEALEFLFQKVSSQGVSELKLFDQNQCKRFEPTINAIAGIYSPRTGIIDSHSLMKYCANMAHSQGVEIVYGSEVNRISKEKDGYIVGIQQENYQFFSRVVINSAGLFSDRIASMAGLAIDTLGYKLNLCKGDYFSYLKPSPVTRLIYPLPSEHCVGLGVHATLDLGARLRFGPDHEYIDAIDYRVSPQKRDAFYCAATKIIPHLEKEDLCPDMAGIRAKIQGPGDPFKDFIIQEESANGLPGLINLIGIESPGLTSCIAIARMVASIIKDRYS